MFLFNIAMAGTVPGPTFRLNFLRMAGHCTRLIFGAFGDSNRNGILTSAMEYKP